MQTEQPLLTIAVPTFNRSQLLSQLLGELQHQLRDQPQVELLISNNASTDNTRETIDRFCREGLAARCFHNSTNIGADANFLQCFTRASGKYLWMFSDDDLLRPGSVRKIVNLLAEAEYDLVYVNSYTFDANGSTQRLTSAARAPQIFTSAARFAAQVHIFLTFISGNIIHRDRVITSATADFSSLVGSNLVQLGWTYAALSQLRKSLYVHERLVGNRAGNTGGYALSQIFGVNLKQVTAKWLTDRKSGDIILNGTLLRFLPGHLHSLREQKDRPAFLDESPHAVLRRVFGNNFRYWLAVYPVIILPAKLGRVWVLLFRVLNKIDKSLGSPLLRWP